MCLLRMSNIGFSRESAPAAPLKNVLHDEKRRKRRKKKKKQKNSVSGTIKYEDYLADSGSDVDDEDDYALGGIGKYSGMGGVGALEDPHPSLYPGPATPQEWEDNYTVGTDINVLIRQTIQNVNQSVCLQGDGIPEGIFGDGELSCFAAAVKHNTSILSIQIKSLPVSDVSLIPLFESLKAHPTLRALDLCGTKGGHGTSKALAKLVCTNPNIIFAHMDEDVLSPADAEIIQEGVQYNAMVCPDPSTNPFHLGLLRKFSALEEEERSYVQSLAPRVWKVFPTARNLNANEREASQTSANGDNLLSSPQPHTNNSAIHNSTTASQRVGRKKTVTWGAGGGGSVAGAGLCPQFLRGSCSFGSRCKFYHPEYTTALSNAVRMSQIECGGAAAVAAGGGDNDDANNDGDGAMNTARGTSRSYGGGGAEEDDDLRSTAAHTVTTRSLFSFAPSSGVDPLRRRRLGSRLRPSHYTLRLDTPTYEETGGTETFSQPTRQQQRRWRRPHPHEENQGGEAGGGWCYTSWRWWWWGRGQRDTNRKGNNNHSEINVLKGDESLYRGGGRGAASITTTLIPSSWRFLHSHVTESDSFSSSPPPTLMMTSLWVMAVSVAVCSGTIIAWAAKV